MNESRLATLEQIREFLAGTCDMAFAIPADEPRRRAFVAKVLRRFRYDCRPKGQRGVLFEYMQRLSGYSRQHLSRLIAQYRHRHSIEPASRASRTSFSRKYQPADVALLAQTDSWHDTLSGPATQVLLRRAFGTFGVPAEALSQISVSICTTCAPAPRHKGNHGGTALNANVPIGIHKPPPRTGLPGYIHIDTVHQGDQDGIKGVCTSTRWISSPNGNWWPRWADQRGVPAAGHHCSCGSPFPDPRLSLRLEAPVHINHEVAELLEKLRVEFTKSRPRHTNDNALAESKNGAVIRKIMGYSHIQQKHATAINHFYTETLNPYT